MRYGLVACGSHGDGRTVGLDDPVGPFQPYDSMILFLQQLLLINGQHGTTLTSRTALQLHSLGAAEHHMKPYL